MPYYLNLYLRFHLPLFTCGFTSPLYLNLYLRLHLPLVYLRLRLPLVRPGGAVLLYGDCRQPSKDPPAKDCYPGAIASKGWEARKRI